MTRAEVLKIGIFLFIFGLFKKQQYIFTTNKSENDLSSFRCRDSNSWPHDLIITCLLPQPLYLKGHIS